MQGSSPYKHLRVYLLLLLPYKTANVNVTVTLNRRNAGSLLTTQFRDFVFPSGIYKANSEIY